MPTAGEQLGIDILNALYAAGLASTNTGDTLDAWKIIGTEIIDAAGGGGGGGVSGPASSTINAIARWANTAGTAIKNSNVRIDRDTSDSFDLIILEDEGGGTRYLSLTAGGAWRVYNSKP